MTSHDDRSSAAELTHSSLHVVHTRTQRTGQRRSARGEEQPRAGHRLSLSEAATSDD